MFSLRHSDFIQCGHRDIHIRPWCANKFEVLLLSKCQDFIVWVISTCWVFVWCTIFFLLVFRTTRHTCCKGCWWGSLHRYQRWRHSIKIGVPVDWWAVGGVWYSCPQSCAVNFYLLLDIFIAQPSSFNPGWKSTCSCMHDGWHHLRYIHALLISLS